MRNAGLHRCTAGSVRGCGTPDAERTRCGAGAEEKSLRCLAPAGLKMGKHSKFCTGKGYFKIFKCQARRSNAFGS